jgi:perosamine synthetase
VTALRVVPPVHSPVTLAAIVSGVGAVAGRAAQARVAVRMTLTERFGSRDLLLTDSGTSALTLALRAAERLAPGPVALPAYSCYDIATAADGAGVEVLLYDLDPATLAPDPAGLRDVLERGARTVVATHLYGIPLDLAAIGSLLRGYDAFLIEDAAQAAGASYDGRPLGSFGSLGVLSFGRGKGVTSGRGGALLANDDSGTTALAAVCDRLRPARTSAMEPIALLAQWLLARPSLYAIPASLPFLGLGETVYRRPRETRGMSPFALGVLPVTLASADDEAASRQAHAERLLARVGTAGPSLVTVRTPAGAMPGYLRLPILVSGTRSKGMRSDAAKRLGIRPGYPGTLGELPGFGARVGNREARLSGARRLVGSLATLPTHDLLREGDLRALERWIDDGDIHSSR